MPDLVVPIDDDTLDSDHYRPSLTCLHRVAPLWLATYYTSRMYQDHRRRLQRIIAVAGLIEIADIDAAWARMFVAHRRRQGANDPEIHAEWQLLRDLLNWCASRGIISGVPVRKLSLADLGLSMDMSSYPLRRLGLVHYRESQRWWNH